MGEALVKKLQLKPGMRIVVGGALLLGLVGCVAVPPAAAPRFRVESAQPGDTVKIDDTTDDVVIDITSERGIGSAAIVRSGKPPKTLTFRLHLKALEEFDLDWSGARVSAHVASADGSVREEVTLPGKPAQPIDAASPYWMPVRIEAKDPTIPLQDGFFAVGAPPAFLQPSDETAPRHFSLKWIDFYR